MNRASLTKTAFGLTSGALCSFSSLLTSFSQPAGGHDLVPLQHEYIVHIENIPSPTFGITQAILRDRRGFLWFGSTHGLQKYDGYAVQTFTFPTERFEGPIISSLVQTEDSSLVLGTWQGLWSFNLRTEKFTQVFKDVTFGDGRIDALAEDSHGTLWIGTRTGGVYSIERGTGTVKTFTKTNGLSDDGVVRIFIDHEGVVWIATHGGLNSLRTGDGHIVAYRAHPEDVHALWSDDIESIDEDDAGNIWVGTFHGLHMLDRSTGTFIRSAFVGAQVADVKAIAHDKSGNIWFEVSGTGLYSLSHGSLTRFSTANIKGENITNPFILALYVDPTSTNRDLLLWVGLRGGGVDKLRMKKNAFRNFTRGENLPISGNGAVLSIFEDHEGIVWIGLWGGGLNALRHEGNGYALVAHYANIPRDPASLPENVVNAIGEDAQGALWVGTNKGLALLDRSTRRFRIFRHIRGDSTAIASDVINKFFNDHAGTFWVCTDGGLSMTEKLHGIRFRSFLNRPQDAHSRGRFVGGNRTTDIIEDREYNLWVSMYGAGINKLKPDGTYTRYLFAADTEGTHENWIFGIHQDRRGVLWFETIDGLLTFDPASRQFQKFPLKELHDTHIFDIAEDQQGFLWLSTGVGLVRVDPRSKALKIFDASDGIGFRELFSEFFRSQRGITYAGGSDGFCEFVPDSVATHEPAPPIMITGFSVFDHTMPASIYAAPRIDLTYDQNYFAFSFASLEYSGTPDKQYAYRMVGVDADWVNAGSRNFASYTNLDPGSYTFLVSSSTGENVRGVTGASVIVTISPPYWQTWWFRGIASALLFALAYAFYRYRVNKFLEIERLRLRIASDLHDDIGSNLSAIALASRSARRAPELTEPTRVKLDEIYETAVQTSKEMKDLVWFIRPENDTLNYLLDQMKETAGSLLGDIRVEFRTPSTGTSGAISIDFKRNVFLAFKEIVTNVAKHSKATEIEIRTEIRDGVFELYVRDNGKGFDEKAPGKGNGVPNMKKRAQLVGGTCTIASDPGAGTSIRFTANL